MAKMADIEIGRGGEVCVLLSLSNSSFVVFTVIFFTN